MSVRTSVVVGGGIALLTVIGVAAIFGESLAALVATPRAETAARMPPEADRTDKAPPGVTAEPLPGAATAATKDGGPSTLPDGSS